jgi:3-oxoacyl-[acyl-carrier-protein] synthase-3
MLVFCGITRYDGGINTMRFAPSISTRLKLALGARNAMVVDLSNACAGMMSGLYVVDDFIKRGAVKVAMVVSGEYISHLASNAQRHVDNGHHLEAASLTLGDAGAAFIAEQTTQPGAGLLGTVFNTFSEHVDLCTGTPCADAPGGEMFTRSKEIHEAGIMNTPDVVGRLLAKVGLKMGDVDHVIIHQTSVKAIQKCNQLVSAVLGPQPKTDWIVNVDTHGNSASTTHFVALRRFLGEGRFKKGARIMLVTQASGLVVGATVFTMDQLGDRYGNTH